MTSPQQKKTSKWVFRSTPTSMKAKQFSVLAVLETLFVLVLYSWLAYHFNYQWWLYLAALAAPLILLRSKPSIKLGLKRLEHYHYRKAKYEINKLKKNLIIITILTVSFAISCYLPSALLTEHQGWKRLMWLAIVSLFVIVVIFLVVAIVTSRYTHLSLDTPKGLIDISHIMPLSGIMGGVMGVYIGTVLVKDVATALTVVILVFMNMGLLAIFLKNSMNNKKIDLIFLPYLSGIFPGFALNIWLHSLFIRLFSTLQYPIAGLKQLPDNMQEILWRLDFTHLPELLPKAKEVSTLYSVDFMITSAKQEDSTTNKITFLLIATLWYIPALFWRWSLKATLWLWWPIAFLLRAPLENKELDKIRDHAVHKVKDPSKWLRLSLGVATMLWLLQAYIPHIQTIIELLPEQPQTLFKALNQHLSLELGLRYFMLWLCCLLSLMVWFKTRNLAHFHKKIIDDETAIEKINIERQALFRKRVEILEKWHISSIVAFIFLGYSFLLNLAYQHYPNNIVRFIPAEFLEYL